MRFPRLGKAVAAAAAVVLLAACNSSGGSNNGSNGGSGGASGGPVTITWFMWSGSDVEKNAWLHVADMVTQKYPNIKVEFQTAPFNDFWTKLTTQAASHSMPCVIGLQGQRAPQFGNLLVPLDDYMSQAGIKAEDYVPSITKGLQYDGKQVALPYDVGPFVMFYNKDAFKAAELKEPAIGWTTDEFMSDAARSDQGSEVRLLGAERHRPAVALGAELFWEVRLERPGHSWTSTTRSGTRAPSGTPTWSARTSSPHRSRAPTPPPPPPTSSWPGTRSCRSTGPGT